MSYVKSNTKYKRIEDRDFKLTLLQDARAIQQSLEVLSQKEKTSLRDVILSIERLTSTVENAYRKLDLLLHREIVLENLPPTLYNVPKNHPIFSGRTPTRVEAVVVRQITQRESA